MGGQNHNGRALKDARLAGFKVLPPPPINDAEETAIELFLEECLASTRAAEPDAPEVWAPICKRFLRAIDRERPDFFSPAERDAIERMEEARPDEPDRALFGKMGLFFVAIADKSLLGGVQ